MSHLRKLWIEGDAGRIEALLRVACPARAAAVIAHPHPLHGGTMHNPVVFHADRELHRAGLTTLRFNFRGVGASEGEHDQGEGEVEDVGAAATWLGGVAIDLPILVVGYSFGSWCGIRYALQSSVVRGVVAIGLPVRLVQLDAVAQLRRPLVVVQGSDDEHGSLEEVEQVVGEITPAAQLLTVLGASHLFVDRAREVGERVVEAVEICLRGFD